MFPSLSRLWHTHGRRVFGAAARRPVSGKQNRQVRLEVENLEERTVPTIVFRPHFGSQTLTEASQNNAMVSPPVYLIFWGEYWGTQQGSQDARRLTTSAHFILDSGYLSGMTQYGSDGKATFQADYTYTSNPKSGFEMTDVQTFISDAIEDVASPIAGPTVTVNRPIYVVVTDPNARFKLNSGGYNQIGTYTSEFSSTSIHMVWNSTMFDGSGSINGDAFTTIFSHELVESMSIDANGITSVNINPPSGLPSKLKGDSQISDNEPDGGRYVYRVPGGLVQAYWSDKDKAFIVPDGQQQNFYLDPIWDSNDNFTGTHDLSVVGGRLGANSNDQISVLTINSRPTVGINGDGASFDAGTIRKINIDTRGRTNTVNVYAVPQGVTLNVDTLGKGTNNTVVVGNNGSLSGIAGTVNVSNASGQTKLVIDASNDGPRNITVTDHSVAFDGLATINYKAKDGTNGVTNLEIWDGLGANQIRVDSVAALTPVTIWGDTLDVLTGAASGQVTMKRYRT